MVNTLPFNRREFKDRLEEHLRGAQLEFYKSRVARLTGRMQWVEHWQRESQDLIDRGRLVLFEHEIRGFKNKRRAADEVIARLRERDDYAKQRAESIIKRDFKLHTLRVMLGTKDTEDFFKLVDERMFE